jgi:hypothetical protein
VIGGGFCCARVSIAPEAVTWTHKRASCGPNTCQRRSDPGL